MSGLNKSLLLGVLLVTGAGWAEVANPPGWGIDARLSQIADPHLRSGLLDRLEEGRITYLREAEIRPDQLRGEQGRRLRELVRHGYLTVGIADLSREVRPRKPENTLGEDLLMVAAVARNLARANDGRIAVWELPNEPDTGACPDLPDRFASYAKAFYYGLKTADTSTRPVLSSAFALPPGPWLERAAANGLLDAADACNFHYYGDGTRLKETIGAFRNLLQRQHRADLPLWLTEAGLNAETPRAENEMRRRQLQADFFHASSRQAAQGGLAAYFPFWLISTNRTSFPGFALLQRNAPPSPAWNIYSRETRRLTLPPPALAPPPELVPVVLQWVPDLVQALPHKMSGAYRFRNIDPGTGHYFMRGILNVYNLGPDPVTGVVACRPPRLIHCSMSGEGTQIHLSLLPRSRLSFLLDFETSPDGVYRRDTFQAVFRDPRSGTMTGSRIEFGIETPPEMSTRRPAPLVLEKVPLLPAAGRGFKSPGPDLIGHGPAGWESWRSTPLAWTTFNGLELKPDPARPRDSSVFWVGLRRENTDPLRPPLAVARLPDGLPGAGFVEVELTAPPTRRHQLRVDLLDDRGRRYCVWENDGANYFYRTNRLLLHDLDFHPYWWGRVDLTHPFEPKKIREIQLRFPAETSEGFWKIRLIRSLPKPG